MDAWVMEVLRKGYMIPFARVPPRSDLPLSLPAYSPSSIRGTALFQEFQDLLHKGAIEPAPPTPGFYSRLFVVQKNSGAWRPIIDLSTLNMYVAESRFHMETPQLVLRSIRRGDWMISVDLLDAYLQIPIHQGMFVYIYIYIFIYMCVCTHKHTHELFHEIVARRKEG